MTTPLYNLSDTWTAPGQDAIAMSVTTGGNSGRLLRLTADSTDKLTVDAAGNVIQGVNSQGYWGTTGVNGTGMQPNTGEPALNFFVNGGAVVALDSGYGGIVVTTGYYFGWGIPASTGGDTKIFRDAANIVAQRVGVNAQTLRVYNTFTDASNYERFTADWNTTSNVCYLRAEAAGTGTARLCVYRSGATTVASLPSASTAGSGARAFVTDATATTFLSTVAGGGSNKVPVVSDGTNWLIG